MTFTKHVPCHPCPWTTPVELVHGRPLVDTVHGPPLWTSSMDARSWTLFMDHPLRTWFMDLRSWTRFMDHPGGRGPWTPARGPGAWNTSVDHPKYLKINFASGVNEFQ